MTDYIYDSRGNAVGFIRGKYIHAMSGIAIGQINGTHVHKLSGSYVGELHKDMVVDKHMGNFGNIGNPGNPGNSGSRGNPGNRGAVNYGYTDVFHKLTSQSWLTICCRRDGPGGPRPELNRQASSSPIQSSTFLVNSEPYYIWDPELKESCKRFLTGLDPDYFHYAFNAHLETEDEKRASVALRLYLHHGLETFFSLVGAFVALLRGSRSPGLHAKPKRATGENFIIFVTKITFLQYLCQSQRTL